MPIQPDKDKTPNAQLALQFELSLEGGEQAPALAPNAKRRLLQLGPRILDYQLKRSHRKSIGFVVDEVGLTISAPRWVTLAQIEEAIREKERWIFAKIAEMREHRRAHPRVHWEHGAALPYLGAPIKLVVSKGEPENGQAVCFDVVQRELTIHLPPSAGAQQIKDRAQGWLQSEARRIFAERLEQFAQNLGVRPRSFRLSSAATRWGSCSTEGKILLNWRLIHFPLTSIDYVVAHELTHLKEMNHGPRFWKTLGQILPGFEIARAHLQDPPGELLPIL